MDEVEVTVPVLHIVEVVDGITVIFRLIVIGEAVADVNPHATVQSTVQQLQKAPVDYTPLDPRRDDHHPLARLGERTSQVLGMLVALNPAGFESVEAGL